MKPINIQILMNHSTGISDSYYRATENERLGDYLKGAENILRINDDKLTLQKQVVELTEESKDNEYVIRGKLGEKDQQIKRQERLENLLQSLIDTGQLKAYAHNT